MVTVALSMRLTVTTVPALSIAIAGMVVASEKRFVGA
jgi:hypothetical protein